MAWQPLQDRLDGLPLILAGPMLRRVEPDSVTVWIALKEACQIELEVSDTTVPNFLNSPILLGSRATVALGENLHISAVTATTPNSQDHLVPGRVYAYNLLVQSESGVTLQLSDENLGITYGSFPVPTFVMPAQHTGDLRIFYGSCRKPHDEGRDVFDALDAVIDGSADDPGSRPQQLYLGGDQIYADDVADVVLYMVMDAAATLLGSTWQMTQLRENDGRVTPLSEHVDISSDRKDLLRIANRIPLLEEFAGIENSRGKNHLITMGEYCAMYLLTWSDVLWSLPLPTPQQVFPDIQIEATFQPPSEDIPAGFVENPGPEFRLTRTRAHMPTDPDSSEIYDYVRHFASTDADVPDRVLRVRRLMANIPVYMIFDDHEVADDWNLDFGWCRDVYQKPLGRRVIRNGLTAFALFQAWGNTPKQFENEKPGGKLLSLLQQWRGEPSDLLASIDMRLGVPDWADVEEEWRLPASSEAISWHYSVRNPSCDILVLDTRTKRGFPGGEAESAPALLSDEALDFQIAEVNRSPGSDLTLVLSAVPYLFWNATEEVQKIVADVYSPSFIDREGWVFQQEVYEKLLTKLAWRSPLRTATVDGETHVRDHLVFLSGDVHFGFTMRMQYWSSDPLAVPHSDPSAGSVTVAQLNSSGIHNQEGLKINLHYQGLAYKGLKWLIDKGEPLVHLGWVNPSPGQKLQVAAYDVEHPDFGDLRVEVDSSDELVMVLQNEYAHQKNWRVEVSPHWLHRIDIIRGEKVPASTPPTELNVSIPPDGSRTETLEAYAKTATKHKEYLEEGKGTEFVGFNNVGEVTFEWTPDSKRVIHKLWWSLRTQTGWLDPLPLTEYSVSLEHDAPDFPRPIVP